MIKFYWHRGARADALETETEHESVEDLIAYIRNYKSGPKNLYGKGEVEFLELEWWVFDEDYTHTVVVGGVACGHVWMKGEL